MLGNIVQVKLENILKVVACAIIPNMWKYLNNEYEIVEKGTDDETFENDEPEEVEAELHHTGQEKRIKAMAILLS